MMRSRHFITLILISSLAVSLSGCGPTYPKERIRESIAKVCKDEYKLDVKVETIGKTIAIYVPLENLIDFTFSITKSASEKINDVILSVSRVTLSTDAEYDFYCVIAHDIRLPEIQIVIVKSVEDVKRFLLNDISRSEYSKRMIIDIRLSPQAQKERSIKDVFEKMKLDKKWQEDIMNDFFRAEPAGLGEIGYWGGRFYIKDVSKSEFLAEQIASRIRIEFREDKDLSENAILRSVKSSYVVRDGKRAFFLEFMAEHKIPGQVEGDLDVERTLAAVVKVAGHVLHSYYFTDYDLFEIWDQKGGAHLRITPDMMEVFRKKKLAIHDLILKAKMN